MKFPFFLLLLTITLPALAQTEVAFRVMWYNVENLFDPEESPNTTDKEYLPSGNRRWGYKRYNHKLQQIAKVITAAGEWDTPALIGLCEVENDSVLTHLLRRTPLRHQQYHYSITKGSDPRGIQVALLYQRDKFSYKGEKSYPIHSTQKHPKHTRDILHVYGEVINGDTLDVFLCHFPSRSGGEKESEHNRIDASRTLRHLCDSIHLERETPQLLIMGDFNDTPQNKSIQKVLQAHTPYIDTLLIRNKNQQKLLLFNLFADLPTSFPGSHKYQGEWNMLDQIIVSQKLIDPSHTMRLQPGSVRLFTPSFLYVKDKTWGGIRPKRTHYGFKYEGGYSDHFPLTADWLIRNTLLAE